MYDTPAPFRGNLGADPEVKQTANGHTVARLRVASDGPRDKPAVWVDVQIWNELADRAAAVLTKGMPVVGLGHWEQSNYETENGDRRSRRFISAWALGPDLSRAEVSEVRRPEAAGDDATATAPAPDPFDE